MISNFIEFLAAAARRSRAMSPRPLRTEEAVKLLRFASGKSNDAERAEICAMLRLHPAWLRWLADRVKLARNIGRQGAQEAAA